MTHLKEQYHARKQAGLCVSCGTHPAEGGRVRCGPCSLQQSLYVEKHHAAKRAGGICLMCREPAAPGKLRCARHLEYYRERMRRERARRVA